ncbi:MAG: hypothetical protein WAV23_03965 [Minisyncoccia bacterium]
MSGENKNLKDTQDFIKDTNSSLPPLLNKERDGVRFGEGNMSYTKTNKLITALYMVTDIMDMEEPLRNKLRNLGSDVVSDTYIISTQSSFLKHTANKISEIISFLDIASAVGMISEMNHSILKKEFIELKNSLQEKCEQGLSLSELFPSFDERNTSEEQGGNLNSENQNKYLSITKSIPPTRNVDKLEPTRIGVQKGSTLLGALNRIQVSDSRAKMSDINTGPLKNKTTHQTNANDFDVLKKKRREEVLKIVRENKETNPSSGGATISDIRLAAKGVLVSCGEKTLQRELVSMVKDMILKKVGEKRWSKYFI